MYATYLKRFVCCSVVLGISCQSPPSTPPFYEQPIGTVVLNKRHETPRVDEPAGKLSFQVVDRQTQELLPSRVLFRPSPFAHMEHKGGIDFSNPANNYGTMVGPGALAATNSLFLVTGNAEVSVPPGTYELFITHGPEYDSAEVKLTVTSGEAQSVYAELDRVVDTRGWLAADMHVHTANSFDSALLPERRVISMVTSGIEVIVPTDHLVVTDLSPQIAALGYGPELVGQVSGNEFGFKEGHGGAYPVSYDPLAPRGGSFPYQLPDGHGNCAEPMVGINCFTAVDAFAKMHDVIPGTTVVTVNHPWWPTADLGYFTNVHWGAGSKERLPAAGMFDALEVLNGYWQEPKAEAALVADWFELLGQGHRVTALGNSDSHRLNWVQGGYPRTWLRLPMDRPGDITGATLAEAIRNQRAVASTGPFALLTVDGAQIGDTVIPRHPGQVAVEITVDAPNWIDVDTVRLLLNGKQIQTITVNRTHRPLFHETLFVPVHTDSWIVVNASGKRPLPPDVVGEFGHTVGREVLPWVITNPVFVDADGDGRWQPPSYELFGAPAVPPSGSPHHAAGAPGRSLELDGDGDDDTGEPPLDAFSPLHHLMPSLYP